MEPISIIDDNGQNRRFSLFNLLLMRCVALSLIGLVSYTLLYFPVARVEIALSLVAYLVVLCFFPSFWLIAIPTLLPVLDLSPWSGRVLFNEFDFFVLITCAAGYWRKDTWWKPLELSRISCFFLFLIIFWQIYTTLHGLLPIPDLYANELVSHYSNFRSLRIGKGFMWALLLLPLLGQAISRGAPVAKYFTQGLLLSLLAAVVIIVWERALFAGILNFDKPYRVTGFFSSMGTGGAPIDAHLLLTFPFLAALFLAWRSAAVQLIGWMLLVSGIYALEVTFSRANYLSIVIMSFVVLVGWLQLKVRFSSNIDLSKMRVILLGGIILFVISFPLFFGSYIQSRFSSLESDFYHRVEHWSEAIDIMDDGLSTAIFGMGKGVFPKSYFWSRSQENLPPTIRHQENVDNKYMKFGKSGSAGNLFLKQRFTVKEKGPYRFDISLRPRENEPVRLLVEICERLIFQPYKECDWFGINTHSSSEKWVNYQQPINVDGLGKSHWYGSRPVEIVILNRGLKSGVDIDKVDIVTPSGNHLLSNGDFESGLDRWYIYSGDHLAFHIKNIFVDAYFEGGWIGLIIFISFVVFMASRFYRRLEKGDVFSVSLMAAFAGLFGLGLFDSLFDDYRIGFLFFLSSWAILSGSHKLQLTYADPASQDNKYIRSVRKVYLRLPVSMRILFGVVSGITVIIVLIFGATRHYNISPLQLVVRTAEKVGIGDSFVVDFLLPKSRYSNHRSHGTIRDEYPRILLPELSQWDGLSTPALLERREMLYKRQGIMTPDVCSGGGLPALAVCWIYTADDIMAEKLITQLKNYHLETPTEKDGQFGNAWEFALAYDLVKLYPGFKKSDQEKIEDKLRIAVRHSLLLLDGENLSLWHGRSTLASIAWLCALVLDQGTPVTRSITNQAQAHFIETIKAIELTEAWPEGYSYWINNRGFLISLAASGYLNGLDDNKDAKAVRNLLKRVGYWTLYATRPDNRIEGFGDEGPRVDLKDETRRVIDLIVQATKDPVLASYSRYLGKLHGRQSYYRDFRWGFRLFNDPSVQTIEGRGFLEFAESMPESEVFGRDAMGMVYIRSGWSKNHTFINFRAGDTLTHHGHYDAGHFTIFKGSPLAINSSVYGDYFGENRLNYSIRSIAKNTLLIQRPNEKVKPNRFFKESVSDGGQRVTQPTGSAIVNVDHWRANLRDGNHLEAGKIEHFERQNDRFTYLSADLTSSYNTPEYDEGGQGGKVTSVKRELLYLNQSDKLIIHDKIKLVSPKYRTKWLLHTVKKPDINDSVTLKGSADNGIVESKSDIALIQNGNSTLSLQRILPKDGVIRMVGGNDYQYYIESDGDDSVLDGKNYSGGVVDKPWHDEGMWRLELQASGEHKEVEFLVVLTPRIGGLPVAREEPIEVLSGDGNGLTINNTAVLFASLDDENKIKVRLPDHIESLRIVSNNESPSVHVIHSTGTTEIEGNGNLVYEFDLKNIAPGVLEITSADFIN